MKIVVHQAYRGWHAFDEDTYDGTPAEPGYPASPIGWGETPEEAVADLMFKLDDDNNEQLRYETETGS